MSNDKHDLPGSTPDGDEAHLAARNGVAVSGRNPSMVKIVVIGVGLLVVVLAMLIVPRLAGKKTVEKGAAKKDESLALSETQDNSIAALQKQMTDAANQRKKEIQDAQDAAEKKRQELAAREQALAASRQRLAELEHQSQSAPPPNAAASTPGRQGDQQHPLTPQERKLQGSVLVKLDGDNNDNPAPASADKTANPPPANEDIGTSLSGEEFQSTAASVLKFNPTYLLARGAELPCVLKTKIVTSYKGLAICQLTRDIYSDDNKTLLLRRGSQFFGEQKQALLKGVTRVFINWTEVDTPEHIRVRINALGTDTLGAAGAPAWADEHLWERFRGAIMLSFIGDSLSSLSNLTSKSTITYNDSSSNAKDMAAIALDNDINIPTTGYINQGTLMNILVPRDVDFSGVYKNH